MTGGPSPGDPSPGGPVRRRRGTLRVYLGAAAGVGKTYAMLSEGRRRRARGTDVVVGVARTYSRPQTAALLEGLERLPARPPGRAGGAVELDVAAVLARRPDVVLVDELAHTNPPGSRNACRWQDVEDIREAGIDVVSTLNIGQLSSLSDLVEAITDVPVSDTVPDDVVRRADQIELVDMTPEALRRRLAHGNVFPPEAVDAAVASQFRTGTLTALRELTLLWLADRVEASLEAYRDRHGVQAPWPTRERVVVGLAGTPGDERLLRRAARLAGRRPGGELIAVQVVPPEEAGEAPGIPPRTRELAESLGGTVHRVVGGDRAAALLEFARGANASQIVLGVAQAPGRLPRLRPTLGDTIAQRSGPIDVHLIGLADQVAEGADGGSVAAGTGALSRRRTVAGWMLAATGPVVLTAVMLPFRDRLTLSTHAMIFMVLTVTVALLGGLWPALFAAVVGSLLLNWFFTPPYSTLTIASPEHAFALAVFVVVAVAVSSAVDLAARRTSQAARSARESETLSLLARGVLEGEQGVDAVLGRLAETLGMVSVCLLERDEERDAWTPVAIWGDPPSLAPEAGDESVMLSPGLALAMRGRSLPAADRRMLEAFAAQAAVVLERQRLRQRAREAADLAHADAVRTALLAAVSHDLRTPLATVKAAVSSLRQPDVHFDADDEAELLATIEHGADRLESLIENLLDVTRLQTGAVQPRVRPVALDEVVPRSLAGLPPERLTIDVDEALPLVPTDAGLVERILANVVQNALAHADTSLPVLVAASARAGAVEVRVVDRGRGVPDDVKPQMFAPFRRLAEGPSGGVGLGLVVARGFAEALGGSLEPEDTPGSGLTMVLTLPVPEPGRDQVAAEGSGG